MPKSCLNCGTEVAETQKHVYQASAEGLVSKVKEIIRDAKIKRVVIKNENGKILLAILVSWEATRAVVTLTLAPWLAALGVIARIVTNCRS
jgi:Domain of unknown function (DUF4342)